MKELKISIITASYNYAQFIKETINSVLAQTYSNWELIVVDDGSKDNSVEVISEFCQKDSRIKLFQHADCEQRAKRLVEAQDVADPFMASNQGADCEQRAKRLVEAQDVADPFMASNQVSGVNKGLKETVLLGIANASGDYIAFLESDDIWAENYLQEKVKIAKEFPQAKVIFNDVELFGDEKVIDDYDKYFKFNRKILSKKKCPTNLFNGFSFQNLIPTFSCVMVEKNALKTANFDTSVPAFLDHWIWAHLAYENEFYYLDKKLTRWRMHSKSYIEQKQQGNEKNFLPSVLKSFQKLGMKNRMFFWNRHKNPKIEKLFRGFFRLFV